MAVSEMRNATAALGGDFFERLFDGAGLAIFACDRSGNVRAANAEAVKLAPQLQPGDDLRRILPRESLSDFDQSLHDCLSTCEPLEFRTRLNGTDYAVWITPQPTSQGGELDGVAVWFHDITARMQIRRNIRKQQRLSTLGALSGAVAHHYNNLLCSIATSLEYALNMNTMSAMRRALQRTAEAAGRANRLTQQLLAFAQADHRTSDEADLTETIFYFFDENEQTLRDQGIELDFRYEPIPVVPLPRDRLMLIISNLVENAVEAMPSGGRLSVILGPKGDKHVRLAIADSGTGISQRDMEHLFEPFFTTKGELGNGTQHRPGMGLAVVHGLVNEMHGSIIVANQPEGGARFEITLPVSGVSAEDSES